MVFYGRNDELEKIIALHPEMAPYLPLKIAVFAEESQTLLIANNPLNLQAFFAHPDMKPITERWARDLQTMLDKTRTAE